jgi:hypothetical protein
MSVDRDWLDSWLDDSGTGTDGTILNHAGFSVFVDAVDDEIARLDADIAAAGGGSASPTEQTTTSTGTQNNFSLSATYTFLRCNNASALVLTGFTIGGVAPTGGERVIIENIGSSTVRVTHQDTGSTAAHRAICPSTNGQVIGPNGRMECVYDTTTDRWREQVIDTGAPIAVAFNAGDFTAAGSMTWTVGAPDVLSHTYQQFGRIITVRLTINSSTVGGTLNNHLKSAIPGGFVASNTEVGTYFLRDNGTPVTGLSQVVAAATVIQWYRIDVANFATATNTTDVLGTFEFTVD